MNYEIEQGTEEWKALRAGCITASCIPKVMSGGIGKKESITRKAYMTQLIVERLTGKPTPDEYEYKGRDVERGKRLEFTARTAYEMTVSDMVQSVAFVEHPRIEYAGCSPDGLVGTDGLCQIKAPRRHVHLEYITTGIVPIEYRPQMYFELACTQRKWNDFVSYNEDFPEHLQLFVCRLPRDEAEIQKIEEAVLAFNADLKRELQKIPKRAGQTALEVQLEESLKAVAQ